MDDSPRARELDPGTPSAALPAEDPSPVVGIWRDYGQWLLAAAFVVTLAWITFTHDGWVPILSAADLGVHEFGHLLLVWAPRPLTAFGGSALQLVVPALLAAYFWRRRDRFATALMLAWEAENINNVSVYLYDATRMALPLFGDVDGAGSGHDWHYLLGPEVLNTLGATDAIAFAVRGLSVAVFALALWMALSPLIAPRYVAWRDASEQARLRQRRKTLPVREPRNAVEPPRMPSPAASGTDQGRPETSRDLQE